MFKNTLYSLIIFSLTLLLGVGCDFFVNEYMLNIDTVGEGSVHVHPLQEEYVEGTIVELTAIPLEGWSFKEWQGDVEGVEEVIEVEVDEEKSITAVFERKEYSLIIEVIGEGEVKREVLLTPVSDYPYETVIELTAVPSEGWSFKEWQGDVEGVEEIIEVEIDGEKSITAVFERKEYSLIIEVIGEGEVKREVLLTPASEYPYETAIELTAVPSEGWAFKEWEGDVEGVEEVIEVEIDEEKSVTAVFERKEYPLIIEVIGEGEVKKEVLLTPASEYPYETVIELTAFPSEGWSFKEWEGDVEGVEEVIEVEVDEEKSITAVFERKEYSLIIEVIGEGEVKREVLLTPASEYPYETVIELTAVPSEGWSFKEWQGDVEGVEEVIEVEVDVDKEITAVFEFSLFHVPQDYSTIQEAIEEAHDGYIIVVHPGEYRENLNFLGKDITLRSSDPEDPDSIKSTIIHGNDQGRVVTFQSGESQEALLWGFTITGGNAGRSNGGGILITESSSPVIKGNIICFNQAHYGAGIAVGNNASPTITTNTVEHNTATGSRGAGLYVYNGSNVQLLHNVFKNHLGSDGVIRVGSTYSDGSEITMHNTILRNNSTDYGVGGLNITAESRGILDGNYFESNTGGGDGGAGALAVTDGSEATIVNNSFHDNKGIRAGAVYVYSYSKALFSDNQFTSNQAGIPMEGYGLGGGILASYHVEVDIVDNTFYNNRAQSNTHGGGAIAIYSWGQTTKANIKGNTFNSNRALRRGAGLYVTGDRTKVDINGNWFFSNRASDHHQARGGAIYIGGVEEATIYNNGFINNYAKQYGGGIFIHRDANMKGPLGLPWSPVNYPPFQEPFNHYYLNDHEGNDFGPIGKHVFVDT